VRTLLCTGREKTTKAEVALAGAAVLSRAAGLALRIHGLKIRAEGPLPPGPALLVANHLSYLDPLLVASQVECTSIAKAELAAWPVFGALARRLGVLFVERASPRSRSAVLREAEQVLLGGGRLLNFPEGTTSDGATVLPFRKGLFGLAQALGIPVVPVALRYQPPWLAWTGEATFVPHYLRFAAAEKPSAELAFGAPLSPASYATAEGLAAAARKCILSLLEKDASCLRKML
jgi:1-acyl-sn-glycerol-3-phosphate acyltransferase